MLLERQRNKYGLHRHYKNRYQYNFEQLLNYLLLCLIILLALYANSRSPLIEIFTGIDLDERYYQIAKEYVESVRDMFNRATELIKA